MRRHDVLVLESAQGGRTALHTFLQLHPEISMIPKQISRAIFKLECQSPDPTGTHASKLLVNHASPLLMPPWDQQIRTGVLVSGWEIDSWLPTGQKQQTVAPQLRVIGDPDGALLQLTRNPFDGVLVTERRLMVDNAWKIAAGQAPEHPHTPLDQVFDNTRALLAFDRHRKIWRQPRTRWRTVDFSDLAPERVQESMRDVYAHLQVDPAFTSPLFTVPFVDMLGHWLINTTFDFSWHDLTLQLGLDRTVLVPLERAAASHAIAHLTATLPRMRGGTRDEDLTLLAEPGPWQAIHRTVRTELTRPGGPLETFLHDTVLPTCTHAMQTIADYVAEHCPAEVPADLRAHIRTELEPELDETLAQRPELADRWGWTRSPTASPHATVSPQTSASPHAAAESTSM